MTPDARMTAEERAGRILDTYKGNTFSNADEVYQWLERRILYEIRVARADALEEAAQIAEASCCSCTKHPLSGQCLVSEAIRALAKEERK